MKTIRDNNESSESTGIETALATGPMPAAAGTGEARMAAGTAGARRPGRAHGLRGLVVCAGRSRCWRRCPRWPPQAAAAPTAPMTR